MHRIVTEPNILVEYQGSPRIFAVTNNVYKYSLHRKKLHAKTMYMFNDRWL